MLVIENPAFQQPTFGAMVCCGGMKQNQDAEDFFIHLFESVLFSPTFKPTVQGQISEVFK